MYQKLQIYGVTTLNILVGTWGLSTNFTDSPMISIPFTTIFFTSVDVSSFNDISSLDGSGFLGNLLLRYFQLVLNCTWINKHQFFSCIVSLKGWTASRALCSSSGVSAWLKSPLLYISRSFSYQGGWVGKGSLYLENIQDISSPTVFKPWVLLFPTVRPWWNNRHKRGWRHRTILSFGKSTFTDAYIWLDCNH